MGRKQLEELREKGYYFSVPKGISMKPMIQNRRGIVEIHTLKDIAKKYDVVLYNRIRPQFPDGQGVLHRVIEVHDDHYIIMGDNCWQREYVLHKDTVGIMTRFYRKGRWIDVNDKGYQLYVRIWMLTMPVRRPLFFIRDKAKGLLRKVYRFICPRK